ncbi:type VI secretion system secreted protein Hcp [Natronocella acetinitrilica]|jgi:type VI secretion system secreted protein Hcp|uniref:Type VI secretion system secreted protein Hcp n=1 Tax=Natronocella acetinitrilica TaxID=414046 RepID=A0AAE3G3C2_9GAMM|nr:type VI secretion system tube protein Hcp [Natronocella acetinitrilica]MCP1673931.1 type VI secretion system secreted protein Hcp [Natronocella acetinitrilica]
MAVDSFLKLEGVDGESSDSVHADEIDVLAWSWGASNSGTMHEARGGGAGKANFQDISITKWIDKATPTIWRAVAKGIHYPSGKLTVRKAGGDDPLEYLVIELKSIMITSTSTGGSSGEDRLTENITLNFSEFKINYTPQAADGTAGAAVDYGYNIAESKDA